MSTGTPRSTSGTLRLTPGVGDADSVRVEVGDATASTAASGEADGETALGDLDGACDGDENDLGMEGEGDAGVMAYVIDGRSSGFTVTPE